MDQWIAVRIFRKIHKKCVSHIKFKMDAVSVDVCFVNNLRSGAEHQEGGATKFEILESFRDMPTILMWGVLAGLAIPVSVSNWSFTLKKVKMAGLWILTLNSNFYLSLM